MAWRDRHGWKWIGAPQSGVLALFGAHDAAASHPQDSQLSNEPSHASNRPLEATPSDVNALPRALRLVLLGVEIVLALAVGLLCVWCASAARTIVRAVTSSTALAECAYTAVFAYGLVAFFLWIFQQSHSRVLFLKRLGLLWTPLSTVAASLLLHSACLHLLMRGGPTSVHSLVSFPNTLSLRHVVLAPLEEELFFRALVGHLALHRLRGRALASAAVSSAGFALVHLANARRVHQDGAYGDVAVQIAWALVVGVFLGLRYARKGSLLECVLLHVINNAFAAMASSTAIAWEDPGTKTVVAILSIVAYALASLREWHAVATSTT